MTTPIDPELCKNTGRLLTEWFEYPEYTDEDLRAKAKEETGFDPERFKGKQIGEHDAETAYEMGRYNQFVSSMKNRKWKNNMTKQEVAARMNEASKMIDPSNFKFLDDETRKRTGLEVNPLWMMECLYRSGSLTPKEQLQALKELAQYTHSKAPNINHNTNTTAPEEWLLELSKEDYELVDELPSFQPRQLRERGAGRDYETRRAKRVELANTIQEYSAEEIGGMAEELEGFDFDEFDASTETGDEGDED